MTTSWIPLRFLRQKKAWTLLFAIGYWIVAGAVPTLMLFLEFRLRVTAAGQPTTLGSLCARVYSPMFMYPLVFGPFLAWFLVEPVIFVWSMPQLQSGGRYVVGAIMAVSVLAAVVCEFKFGNKAIWEFNPSMLNGQTIQHFVAPTDAGREPFEEALKKLGVMHTGSWTLLAYRISFIFQLVVLLAVLVCAGLLAVLGPTRRHKHYHAAVVNLSASVVMSLLWLMMRRLFLEEKIRIYAADAIPGADLIVSALFAAAVAYSAGTLVYQFGEKVKATIEVASAIITLAVFVSPKSIDTLFGRQASFVSYALAFVAVLLIMTPWIVAEFFPGQQVKATPV